MRAKRLKIISLIFLFVMTSSLLLAEEKEIEKAPELLIEPLEKIGEEEGMLRGLAHQRNLFKQSMDLQEGFEETSDPESQVRVGASARIEYHARGEVFKAYLTADVWPVKNIFLFTQAVYNPYESFALKLSAQVGLRLGNFAPRVGIMESQGGVGIDYYAFQDKLKFSAEAFDFKRDPDPHYQVRLGYSALQGLQFIVGLGDSAHDEFREVFLGVEVGF
jgi:phospholipid/cholesterol/gamma-HCH transport system substrate-binding protein